MSRLIDADAYIAEFEHMPMIQDAVRKSLEHMPTIEERKTGRWIRHPEKDNIYGGKCVECSECGETYVVQYIEDEKFCRHCGARMKE